MTTTASGICTDVGVLYKPIIFKSRYILIKIYDILKIKIYTCSCWASVENGLLWRCVSWSSLLNSGFWYTLELHLKPYNIKLYTFQVKGLAFLLTWFPDYRPFLP